MRRNTRKLVLCAGLVCLAGGTAEARVNMAGKHFNAWYDARSRDDDGRFFSELSLINYFFARFTATNQLPDPSGLRGVSLGPIGIGKSTGSATRVHGDTRYVLAEQRWIPVLTFSPFFTDGWAD